MLPENKDEQLLNVMTEYPWLYDSTNEHYKDVIRRKISWKELADRINMNGMLISNSACSSKLNNDCVFTYEYIASQ